MKNLPTTPAPAPEKSWDKRDRAMKAAIAELGPQAIHEFDFIVYKCDKRYMWRALAADKRPPVSDAQVKANGGKRAVDVLIARQVAAPKGTVRVVTHAPQHELNAMLRTEGHGVRVAGEAVAAAAVEQIMSNARKPINLTTDENGFPAFLKREGNETPEQQQARIDAMKKQVGPGRQIKNPPDTEKSKAKAKKEKKTSRMFVATSAILAGKDNAKALAEVLAVFPSCDYKTSDMQWVRRKLIRQGKLKDLAVKADPTAKARKSK